MAYVRYSFYHIVITWLLLVLQLSFNYEYYLVGHLTYWELLSANGPFKEDIAEN